MKYIVGKLPIYIPIIIFVVAMTLYYFLLRNRETFKKKDKEMLAHMEAGGTIDENAYNDFQKHYLLAKRVAFWYPFAAVICIILGLYLMV